MDNGLDRRRKFFDEQYWYAQNFLRNYLPFDQFGGLRVLEVGSGEGGALAFFHELGAECFGVDVSGERVAFAKRSAGDGISFLRGDVCDRTFMNRLPSTDIVVMRDVIEHIPQKASALWNVAEVLKKDGILFVSFPPKYSPYAGHQQNIDKKYGRLPFMHLLPWFFYLVVLRTLGVERMREEKLFSTKENMISIRRMEKLFSNTGFVICRKDFYLIRPCYEKRFGLKPRKVVFNQWPVLKEFLTLGALYLLRRSGG